MARTAIKIGPKDHGRRMSLAVFEHAEVQEGYLYELARGVIIVSDVPKPRLAAQAYMIREQLSAHGRAHPGQIYFIAGGNECKLLAFALESERHPDIAVYTTPIPVDDDDPWARWIPELVIEVVSPGSEVRDYQEKREEYLRLGVREYWLFDADEEEMLVPRWSGNRWVRRTLRPPKAYRTKLLPGLEFDCAAVFAAARGTRS